MNQQQQPTKEETIEMKFKKAARHWQKTLATQQSQTDEEKELQIRSPILLCKTRKSKQLIETNANDGNDYETRIYRNEQSNHHILTCNDEHCSSKLKSTDCTYSLYVFTRTRKCDRKKSRVRSIGANETNKINDEELNQEMNYEYKS